MAKNWNDDATRRKTWPKWTRQCGSFSWRTGQQCKNWAVRGTDRCKKHGSGGKNAKQGWKRFLLWTMLPETIRQTGVVSPVTDEEVEIVCNILAQYIVTGDAHATEGVRMKAIEYLFDAVAVNKHPDPAALLTHLTREQALLAINILRLNNLIK